MFGRTITLLYTRLNRLTISVIFGIILGRLSKFTVGLSGSSETSPKTRIYVK